MDYKAKPKLKSYDDLKKIVDFKKIKTIKVKKPEGFEVSLKKETI